MSPMAGNEEPMYPNPFNISGISFFYNHGTCSYSGSIFGPGYLTIKKLGIINTVKCPYATPGGGGTPQ